MALEVTPDEIEQWLVKGITKTINSQRNEPFAQPDEQSNDESKAQQINSDYMDNYDFAALAQKFKSDEDTIRTTIEKMEEEFRADLPGETDAMYKKFVMHDLFKTLNTGSGKEKADEFNGVVIAVSRKKDLNDYAKRLCWKEYAKNAKDAVKAGYIEEVFDENGKVIKKIPLDTTETINNEPNPNFGKPLEYRPSREMIMVLLGNQKIEGVEVPGNGEVVLVRANFDNVGVGQKSTVYGKKSPAQNKPYTSVVRGWSDYYEENGAYNNSWSVAEKVYNNYYTETRTKDEMGEITVNKIKQIPISQINALPSFGYFITKGNVQSVKFNDDVTKAYLAIEDGDGNSIRGSTNYEPLISDIENLCEGDEVIFIAERSSFKNDKDEWVNYNILMGTIKNPGKNDLAEGIKRLNEVRAAKKAGKK